MAFRFFLFGLPIVVVAALVLLLNEYDASAGVAVVSLGAVAIVSGANLGRFANRLPGSRNARRDHV
jgi:hypothetical protein